tara:strand:- start:475 stop:609 length:135 start_codon:yes stop_codon:yes gene_type:complete
MLKAIKNFFTKRRMSEVDRYLANSVDLVDLERRQQELIRKGIWL